MEPSSSTIPSSIASYARYMKVPSPPAVAITMPFPPLKLLVAALLKAPMPPAPPKLFRDVPNAPALKAPPFLVIFFLS
jgi:hypothetical protein